MNNIFITNEIVRELISSGKISESDLKAIYRRLSKKTHPDITGKGSSDFLRIKNEYEEARSYLKKIKGGIYLKTNFSPTKVIIESGYRRPIEPRSALYIALYRYSVLGLYSYKIRSKPELHNRNLEIIRTVIYWAHLYDPDFISIFIGYNKQYAIHYHEYLYNKKIVRGRRLFIKGLRWFLDYQDQGRRSACEIACEQLNASRSELKNAIVGPLRKSILLFAEWLLNELDLDPLRFQIMI